MTLSPAEIFDMVTALNEEKVSAMGDVVLCHDVETFAALAGHVDVWPAKAARHNRGRTCFEFHYGDFTISCYLDPDAAEYLFSLLAPVAEGLAEAPA